MVLDKDEDVDQYLQKIKNQCLLNSGEIKNLGNEHCKKKDFLAAVNTYEFALTKTPADDKKAIMVLHGNIS